MAKKAKKKAKKKSSKKSVASRKRLPPRQARFVEQYIIDLNATQAAIRAGYSKKTAFVQGSRLLRNAKVKRLIKKAIERRSKRTEVTADKVIKEFARVGFSDLRDFAAWGPTGVKLLESSGLTEDQAASVAEVSESVTGKSKNVRFKLHDKAHALTQLGRHLGLFKDRLEVEGDLNISDAARKFTSRISRIVTRKQKS